MQSAKCAFCDGAAAAVGIGDSRSLISEKYRINIVDILYIKLLESPIPTAPAAPAAPSQKAHFAFFIAPSVVP